MNLTDFDVLTFDCYGTLIDWETGIQEALATLAQRAGISDGDRVLEDFGLEEEAQETETPTLIYSEILARVYQRLAKRWGVQAGDGEADAFGASVPNWPAFADSSTALMYLSKYYKLVILSNVDRVSFAGSNTRLGVAFDAIYTAQDIGSYKPDPRNFAYLIDHIQSDLGLGKDKILHVAQSLFHDHVPARTAGLANVWIDRRYDREGWGATKSVDNRPHLDYHFNSMADLMTAHQQALRAE